MGVSFDTSTGKYQYKFHRQGRLYRKRGFRTCQAARDAEAKRLVQLGEEPQPVTGVTFGEAVDMYLAAHEPPVLAPKTYTKYHQVLEKVMAREYKWATRPLAKITSEEVDAYRRWRLGHTVVANDRIYRATGPTVNRDMGTLSALMSWAHDKPRRWIVENPVRDITLYAEPRIVYQPVSPEERKTMAQVLGAEAVKADLLHCLGVRIDVVFSLRWEQVSFETRTIQYRSKGRDITRPLGQRALALLKGLHPHATGPVFPGASLKRFRRLWDLARRAINRPTLRPHDLRITFARELADEGEDLTTIRDLLGQRTLQMAERYVGSSRRAQERAQAKHDARAGFV